MTHTIAQLSTAVSLDGDYEPTGDVLYLSTPDDDKMGSCWVSPEGHAVRTSSDGRLTHVTLTGAKWYFKRDGELVATLPDGSRLRLGPAELADLLPN